MNIAFRSLSALAVLAFTTSARAEVVELKSGQKIEGQVLKETDREVYVDVGVDVVRIPLDRILSRHDSAAEREPTQIEKNDVFSTAKLPVKTVKELAEQFGEGVVLVQTPGGLGSGFIINDRGYCVTNYHVVEKETRISCVLFHKNKTGDFERRKIEDVKIIALNPFFDLALLQIPEQKDFKFTTVFLSDESAPIREGDEVFAIGNPLGLERSVSQGIVSTKNRDFEGIVYIQTTTQINPGNSGGPLFDNRGQVIGVTNMKLLGGEGLNFAIPIAYVKHFLKNRDAFAFDQDNPNSGYRYLDAPRRRNAKAPPKS
ncbi:Putative serine protease HhoB precursor [Caulifigura coniformis]|uniref:Serine protease HhoB n=1 Tax=Caulifigura coniformis TaxID=2527983 RepID=A0A517SJT5_9PLAN|nr:trypsin-like peptidase domain-containing protein [Caulifigura coniformis]QDT56384.1 Putative serine protease HhoB precursor [Caulifigura coniformis]